MLKVVDQDDGILLRLDADGTDWLATAGPSPREIESGPQ
jgi:hypothetical protein